MAESSCLKITSENAEISRFNSGLGIRCFCSRCGSPLWFESIDHPEIVAIPLGVLDDADVPAPDMHLWIQSKPEWCTITDDLPQHDTHPFDSET